MTATESTSAALRRVEQERDELGRTLADARLALASAGSTIQALLDSDTAIRNAVAPGEDKVFPLDRIQALQAELVSARTELDAVRAARDNLDRQLSEARKRSYGQAIATLRGVVQRTGSPAAQWAADYLAVDPDRLATFDAPALASWVVARDDGYDCDRCHHRIRRGEAYELLPGADTYGHIHCPDRRSE